MALDLIYDTLFISGVESNTKYFQFQRFDVTRLRLNITKLAVLFNP